MIQFFIRIANNRVGRVIFGALLFGMVFVSGIGGLGNLSRSTESAVVVGRKKLSMQQLDERFRQERQKFSELAGGQYISPKQAIEMGLLDTVVQQQLNEMILNGIKEELELTASNAAVQKYVERNPAFSDAAGHFDRNMFMAYLRQMKMNEQMLGRKLQDELATQHLTRAVEGVAYVPQALTRVVYGAQNEQRDVTIALINADKIELGKVPTQKELEDYYEIYASERFMTPEYRSFSYLALTPEMMADRVQIDKDVLDAVVAERRSQFDTPEKRLVSQMYFKDETAAREALDGLTAKNFNERALAMGQSETDTDFGLVTKNELMEELAEPVFQAAEKTVIGPIESMTGWHILLVREIQSAKVAPESEVRTAVRQQLVNEQIYDARDGVVHQLEDLLGEGKSLTDAAKELKLSLSKATADVAGQTPNGKDLPDAVRNQDLLRNLFTLTKGDTTALFESGNSIVVAELTDITPVGTKSFEAVRAELVQLWRENHLQERLVEIADKIMADVQAGKPLFAQKEARRYGLIIQKEGLTREGDDDIPSQALSQIFQQEVGAQNAVRVDVPNGILIATTDKIVVPEPDEEELETVEQSVQDLIGAGLVGGVIDAYANEMGVSVHNDEIRRSFSVYTNTQE